ncbi:MAG: methyltransferase domain-containing protein [Planctomycetales bacterium]|nr:methyltransferase domain-containing protein [Planctomycetales bacterium]
MPQDRLDIDLAGSYDRVAEEYVHRIYDELQYKPLDRELLDLFAERVRHRGLVCEIGCGPGHVARYLHDRGVTVCGVDISPAMVVQARRLNPEIEFRQGDLLQLDIADGAWAGIVAFYSLIHVPQSEMIRALTELRRVLEPGGLLFLAFHIGDHVLHLDEWWGHVVSVDFHLFQPDDMVAQLAAAGFHVEEVIQREPYPNVEHPSRRAYILALNNSPAFSEFSPCVESP